MTRPCLHIVIYLQDEEHLSESGLCLSVCLFISWCVLCAAHNKFVCLHLCSKEAVLQSRTFMVLCAMKFFTARSFFQEAQRALVWPRAPLAAREYPCISSSYGRYSQREQLDLASMVIAAFTWYKIQEINFVLSISESPLHIWDKSVSIGCDAISFLVPNIKIRYVK